MHTTRVYPSSPGATEAATANAAACCPACGDTARTDRTERHRCLACGTVWLPLRRGYSYDDAYPAERGHFDQAIGHCKQVTLQSWLRRTAGPVAGKRVLEVGFGGGATLDLLHRQGALVWGQEPVTANRRAAVASGIDADHIAADLGAFAGTQFNLLLYLDSFEHLLEPELHLRSVDAITIAGSQALVVLPVADSLSRRLMGQAWPHDIPDHWVFYSTRGLTCLWGCFGWRCTASFYPWKFVSVQTLARHFWMKTGLRVPLTALPASGVWLNFGERGFVFEKLPFESVAAP